VTNFEVLVPLPLTNTRIYQEAAFYRYGATMSGRWSKRHRPPGDSAPEAARLEELNWGFNALD